MPLQNSFGIFYLGRGISLLSDGMLQNFGIVDQDRGTYLLLGDGMLVCELFTLFGQLIHFLLESDIFLCEQICFLN